MTTCVVDDDSPLLVRETLAWANRARKEVARTADLYPELLLQRALLRKPKPKSASTVHSKRGTFGTSAAHSRPSFPSTPSTVGADRGNGIVDKSPWLYVAAPCGVVHTSTSAAERAAHDAARSRLVELLGPELGETPETVGMSHVPIPLRQRRALELACNATGPGAATDIRPVRILPPGYKAVTRFAYPHKSLAVASDNTETERAQQRLQQNQDDSSDSIMESRRTSFHDDTLHHVAARLSRFSRVKDDAKEYKEEDNSDTESKACSSDESERRCSSDEEEGKSSSSGDSPGSDDDSCWSESDSQATSSVSSLQSLSVREFDSECRPHSNQLRRRSIAEITRRYLRARKLAIAKLVGGRPGARVSASTHQCRILARHLLRKELLDGGPRTATDSAAGFQATLPHVRGVAMGRTAPCTQKRRYRDQRYGISRMRAVIAALTDLMRGKGHSTTSLNPHLSTVLTIAEAELRDLAVRTPVEQSVEQPPTNSNSDDISAAAPLRFRPDRGVLRWKAGEAAERTAALARTAGARARESRHQVWYASQLHTLHGEQAEGHDSVNVASLLSRQRRRVAIRSELYPVGLLPSSRSLARHGPSPIHRMVPAGLGPASAASRRRRGYGHGRRRAASASPAPVELHTARTRRARSVSFSAMPGRRDVVGPYGLHEPPSPPSAALQRVLRRDAELAAMLHAGAAHDAAGHIVVRAAGRVAPQGPASFARGERFPEASSHGVGDDAFFAAGAIDASWEHSRHLPTAAFVHSSTLDVARADRHVRRRPRRSLGELSFGKRRGRQDHVVESPEPVIDEDGHIIHPSAAWVTPEPSGSGSGARQQTGVRVAHFGRQTGRNTIAREAMHAELDEDGNVIRASDRHGPSASEIEHGKVAEPMRRHHGAALLHFSRLRGRDTSTSLWDLDLDEDGRVIKPTDQRGAPNLVHTTRQGLPASNAAGHVFSRVERGLTRDVHNTELDEDGHVLLKRGGADRTGHVHGPLPTHAGARRGDTGLVSFGRQAVRRDDHVRPLPGHRGALGEFDEDGGLLDLE